MKLHTRGFEYNDGDLKTHHVLLEGQISVGSEEYVKFIIDGKAQKFPIFNSRPAKFLNGYRVVTGQCSTESPV